MDVAVRDQREEALVPVGLIEFEDAETGETILIDTSSRATRERFEKSGADQRAELERLFRSLEIDFIAIRTDCSYVEPLVEFVRQRAILTPQRAAHQHHGWIDRENAGRVWHSRRSDWVPGRANGDAVCCKTGLFERGGG